MVTYTYSYTYRGRGRWEKSMGGECRWLCGWMFDPPLMKALDWTETSGKRVTIDMCPLTSLGSGVLNP